MPPRRSYRRRPWLEITGKTNETAFLTIDPPWNVTNGVYDLYYTTNLSSPAIWTWVLRSFAGLTNLVVNNATDAQGFYRLGPLNDPIGNDSLGTNFWVAFFYMYDGGGALSFCISSPAGASGTVTIPKLQFTNTFSLSPGEGTNMSIQQVMMMDYDLVGTNGIHVITSQPISIYALDHAQYCGAAFTCYPTPLLGTNYCVMAYPGYYGASQFAIVATANNTSVTITPVTRASLNRHTNCIPRFFNKDRLIRTMEMMLRERGSHQTNRLEFLEALVLAASILQTMAMEIRLCRNCCRLISGVCKHWQSHLSEGMRRTIIASSRPTTARSY